MITNFGLQVEAPSDKKPVSQRKIGPCADINIMPASVDKLVFNDPELKKIIPSNLEIGTYTTNAVKIVGSCLFYLVHPDTKKLPEVTFYVAKVMEVSCCPALQHLCLDLYNLTQDWIIYLTDPD